MSNLKIGIDLDNVLADFMAGLLGFYNKKYKTSWKKEDFKVFDLSKTWGGSKERMVEIIHDFYSSNDFKNIVPIEGSQKALRELSENNNLFVITSRHLDIADETNHWLEKHFEKLFDEIILTNSFSLNDLPQKTKVDVCDSLNIDVFIDDSFDLVLECAKEGRRCLLFDSPWNRNFELKRNMERVYSWEDVLERING